MNIGVDKNLFTRLAIVVTLTAFVAAGCSDAEIVSFEDLTSINGQSNKGDSGWLGADSYEVGAVVRGIVRARPSGDWDDVRTDENVQAKLVDQQLKFIKTTAEKLGWRFNQLADNVTVMNVRETDDGIEIEYEAVVDMLGDLDRELPDLSEIDPRIFGAKVPLEPFGFSSSEMTACSKTDSSHSVAAYNFHYYYAPGQSGCSLNLVDVQVEITNVFDRPRAYPEYDKLLQDLGDGTVGFTAALVPNRGDNDPMSRFNAHAKMLEQELNLTGVDATDESFRRYTWTRDGVSIVIDLYNPLQQPWMGSFAKSFRKHLATYTLVHYNGHSSYGSKHLLDEPESFSDAYQIIVMHSCQSYAYYTRQVFRAKATFFDPSGFELADVVATGRSSYPAGSPPTLRVLFQNLMDGMVAVRSGWTQDAPDWLTIAAQMKQATYGDILYGIAGVRTNAWRP